MKFRVPAMGFSFCNIKGNPCIPQGPGKMRAWPCGDTSTSRLGMGSRYTCLELLDGFSNSSRPMPADLSPTFLHQPPGPPFLAPWFLSSMGNTGRELGRVCPAMPLPQREGK